MSPLRSNSSKCSQFAQLGTSMEFEIKTRGASAWVGKMATGFPLCIRSVSLSFKSIKAFCIVSKASRFRAALPRPPYTIKSSGRSATSASKLFTSIRRAASCTQPLQRRVGPTGALSPGANNSSFIVLNFLTYQVWITIPKWCKSLQANPRFLPASRTCP